MCGRGRGGLQLSITSAFRLVIALEDVEELKDSFCGESCASS